MVKKLSLCLSLLLLLNHVPAVVSGAESQSVQPIREAVEHFLRRETAGLPGTVSFSVGTVEPRLNVPACTPLGPFLPAGARLWGHAIVGVRCTGPTPWILYVPVEIRVVADVVHSARPLAQHQPLAEADLVLQKADLTQLPAGVLTDLRLAIGKTVANNVAGGQPLRHDMLRAPIVIQQGQSVRLVVQGRGFSVSSEGRALTPASDGQTVQVRVPSGQVVSGIARGDGVVEVRP